MAINVSIARLPISATDAQPPAHEVVAESVTPASNESTTAQFTVDQWIPSSSQQPIQSIAKFAPWKKGPFRFTR